ncbi:NAD(P)-dependent oxidoreductase [Herbaspirillum rhizosphaerae]|uniref:NAD(P)-dependent oxidoreductase n=1 Tax=Herbaspirillum rhizosphaerae TaxID=346179 RepID=UPI001F0B5927|nr:DUF1932 domain-containing protein [Herbaspirillum rhizosphaerae]
MSTPALISVCLIGYGEAGKILAQGLSATGRCTVSAYDILLHDAVAAQTMHEAASAAGVRLCADSVSAIADADVIISAVTASAAREVAVQTAASIRPGQFFLDINSVSPALKQESFALLTRRRALYVEAAVMASIPPYGIAVPMMLGGPHAAEFMALMATSGMKMTHASPDIGLASAIKMCRSVMIKGLEALTVESMFTARHYGVEQEVLASLAETFPGIDWQHQADYLVSRVVQHGRRRAAEMREVAHTVGDAGLTPWLSSAIAERQDWLADQVLAGIVDKQEKSWREVADRIAAVSATATDIKVSKKTA